MKKNLIKVLSLGVLGFMLAGCGGGEPPHTHSWSEEWSMDDDYHWHACEGCDEIDEDSKEAHDWSEWSVSKAATCSEQGEEKRTCLCGAEETRKTPLADHPHENTLSFDESGHWYATTCEHNDVKIDFEEHDFVGASKTDLVEETPTTAGSYKQKCNECDYVKTVEIPATNEGPIQGATNLARASNIASVTADKITAEDLEMTPFGPGVKVKMAVGSGGSDERLFNIVLDKTYDAQKVTGAVFSAYINLSGASSYSSDFKPFSYQFVMTNSDSANRALTAPSDVSSLREKKPNATGAWMKLTINLSDCTNAGGTDHFDRLNIRIKNSYLTWNTNDVITIASAYIVGGTEYVPVQHNMDTNWSVDDEYHWHACLDSECTHIEDKAKHTWIADINHDDVPATADATGMEYRVCEVCGKTKETVIPKIGDFSPIEVSNGAKPNSGITDELVQADGTNDLAGFTVLSFNSLTTEKQHLCNYSYKVSDVNGMTNDYNTVSFKVANMHSDTEYKFVMAYYYKDEQQVEQHLIKAVTLTGGTSSSAKLYHDTEGRVEIKVKPGETVTVSLRLTGDFLKVARFYMQTKTAVSSAGSIAMSKQFTYTHVDYAE